MIALLVHLVGRAVARARSRRPTPYLPSARYAPTLSQIKAWNEERLNIAPALNRRRAP